MDWSALSFYGLAGLVGAVSGAIGSTIGVFVNWKIEQKRKRIEYRQKMLQYWRKKIALTPQNEITATIAYSQMRTYLSKEVRDSVESGRKVIRVGRGGNLVKSLLLDDLSRLESEWGLL